MCLCATVVVVHYMQYYIYTVHHVFFKIIPVSGRVYIVFLFNRIRGVGVSYEIQIFHLYQSIDLIYLDFDTLVIISPSVGPQLLPIAFNTESANQGDSVSVTCSVLKGDMPMDITWAFNAEPIQPSVDQSITIYRMNKHLSTLSIDGAAARHAGEYSCTASNVAGSVSHSTQLAINGIPFILTLSMFFLSLKITVIFPISWLSYSCFLYRYIRTPQFEG